MAEVETQEFLTMSSVRDSLGITEATDDRLLPIIESANRQITLSLVPVLDIRLLEGTTYWQDASNVALLYFNQSMNAVSTTITRRPRLIIRSLCGP